VAAGVLLAFGLRTWASVSCFALSAFVCGTILQEFAWGANIRRKNTGTDFLTALVGLVGRNKRRYGGYIVHIGIVLMFIGFAGGAYKIDQQTALKLGDKITVGSYTIRNDGIKVNDDGQRQMTTAYLSVFDKNGKQIDSMYPARWAFRKHEDTPTTEVAIRRGFGEDLYVVMPSNDPATVASQVAPLEVIINPLVDWIWLGFGVIAFGTGIALLPERAYSFAIAKMPAEAATTAVFALMLVLGGTSLHAQAGMPPGGSSATQTSYYPRTEFEREMQHEIVCTCGCGHVNIAECRKDPCATSHELRGELANMVDRGLTRDQVKAEFIANYGNEEMIGTPIPKGFRPLSWILPVIVGGGAAAAVGFVAMKWSRKHDDPSVDVQTAIEPEMDERLDDELRNLD
jgi:cytochrome c-type biogenesis protein CcmF